MKFRFLVSLGGIGIPRGYYVEAHNPEARKDTGRSTGLWLYRALHSFELRWCQHCLYPTY